MSTLETILSRAMSDPSFADAILADHKKALREYALSNDELAQFQGLSRADFDALAASPEERQSFCLGCNWGPPLTNHNQTALKVQVIQHA
jgi:hypothetical protein